MITKKDKKEIKSLLNRQDMPIDTKLKLYILLNKDKEIRPINIKKLLVPQKTFLEAIKICQEK